MRFNSPFPWKGVRRNRRGVWATTPSAFAATPSPAKGTCLRRKFLHLQKLDPGLRRDDGVLESIRDCEIIPEWKVPLCRVKNATNRGTESRRSVSRRRMPSGTGRGVGNNKIYFFFMTPTSSPFGATPPEEENLALWNSVKKRAQTRPH